ncbi:MAG: peptidylprolyl isomerase [Comamonas sp.]|nr:peptidylprolyl isomerase [Candidatus Comamonas equi]
MRHLISMPRHFVLGLVCAAALSSWSVQAQSLRSADYIVAVVNSEPVTNNEVRARIQRVREGMAAQGITQLPSGDQVMAEVLERLIIEKAQVQTARESGIQVDDYAVDQAMQNLARQNGLDLQGMQRKMAQQGVDPAAFREDIRNQMLIQRLQNREVDGRVQVTDQDIEQYLADQRRKGGDLEVAAAALNLGHILIEVPERATPAQLQQLQARAQEAAQAAQTNPDFAAVARRYSQGGQAVLGLRPADRYPALFVESVAKTPAGGVVGPVRSAAGFHVLKVIERSTSGVPSVVTQNHARHILLRTSPQLGEREAAQKLSELRKRFEGGASFETLARQFSEDGSAAQGGDLGWAGPGRYVPEFEEALDALQPGQVSQPVVSRFGVHLIQLVERRQATLSPREQRDMLRDVVREQKLDKAQATWLQELRGQAYVEYREPPQ